MTSLRKKLPVFRELNVYNVGGHIVTNEEPELIRELLGSLGRKFKLGGGICSGGEVAFMSLMPFCEQTVLVDHGLNACASAYYKATLLSEMGAKRFRDMIVRGNAFELVMKGSKLLARLQKDKSFPKFAGIQAFPKGPADSTACLSFNTLTAMQREYFYTPPSVLRQTRAKLDTLTIAHGDLLDLQEFGKFDLMYLSNAFGHTGRNGQPTLAKSVTPLMADGGIALSTQVLTGVLPKGWTELTRFAPLRTSWNYVLLQYNG